MKKFIEVLYTYFELAGKVKAATMLTRMGRYKEAAVLMQKD